MTSFHSLLLWRIYIKQKSDKGSFWCGFGAISSIFQSEQLLACQDGIKKPVGDIMLSTSIFYIQSMFLLWRFFQTIHLSDLRLYLFYH